MAKLWFNPEKKGYNQLGDFLWLDCDFRVTDTVLAFTELRINKLDDGGYVLGMWLQGCSNLSDRVSVSVFPLAAAIYIRPPGSKYEIYSLEDKGKKEIDATPSEAVIKLALDSMECDKFYEGSVAISCSSMNESILAAPELIKQLSPFKLKEIESCKNIGALALESSKTGGKGNGQYKSSGESQATKIMARQGALKALFCEAYGLESIDWATMHEMAKVDGSAGQFLLVVAELTIKP